MFVFINKTTYKFMSTKRTNWALCIPRSTRDSQFACISSSSHCWPLELLVASKMQMAAKLQRSPSTCLDVQVASTVARTNYYRCTAHAGVDCADGEFLCWKMKWTNRRRSNFAEWKRLAERVNRVSWVHLPLAITTSKGATLTSLRGSNWTVNSSWDFFR